MTFFCGFFVYLHVKWKAGKKEGKGILLLPPTDLNGCFGDELMVASFIHNFAEGEDVTILTKEVYERSDFLSDFPGISFLGGVR